MAWASRLYVVRTPFALKPILCILCQPTPGQKAPPPTSPESRIAARPSAGPTRAGPLAPFPSPHATITRPIVRLTAIPRPATLAAQLAAANVARRLRIFFVAPGMPP